MATSPNWYHWIELVLFHTLKAVDLMDILEVYLLYEPHVLHNSVYSGFFLFFMHITVDIYILSVIVNTINSKSPIHKILGQQDTLFLFFERTRRILLLGTLIAFCFLFFKYFLQDPFNSNPFNLFLWPVDNFLRTLDFGDAFEIFEWQFHSMPMTLNLSVITVIYRIIISSYVFEIYNSLYLNLLKGKGKTIEELGAVFTSTHYSVPERKIAAEALKNLGEHTARALPYLATGFKSNFPDIRKAARNAMISIGEDSIYTLVILLANKNPAIHKEVIDTLNQINPKWAGTDEAKNAVPQLIERISHGDVHVRNFANDTLERIAPNWPECEAATEAIPHFLVGLNDKNHKARTAAAEALGIIRKKDSSIIFRLIKSLVDEHGHVRGAAYESLNKIDPEWQKDSCVENAVAYLIRSLKSSNETIRNSVPTALKRIGAPAVPSLISSLVLEEDNKTFTQLILEALLEIGEPAVPSLIKIVEEGSPAHSKNAARIIGEIGQKSISHIIPALCTNNQHSWESLGEVLLKIGPTSIPQLINAISNTNVTDKRGIIVTLGKFGPGAAKAVPHLLEAEESNTTAIYAQESLEKIDPKGHLRQERNKEKNLFL